MSLMERHKARTELEISRCAMEMFVAHGVSAVTAEQIADAAGIGLRTFYRYFRTKEEAVAPLLVGGVSGWIALLTEAYANAESIPESLEQAAKQALTPSGEVDRERMQSTRGLLRIVHNEPELRAVWLRVQQDTEEELNAALTPLMSASTDPLTIRLVAASANAAMRVAVETWAETEAPVTGPDGPAELAAHCIRTLVT